MTVDVPVCCVASAAKEAARLKPAARFELGELFLADAIAAQCDAKGGTLIVGLCGPQGSGKSTLAHALANRLMTRGYEICACSLDDFYLTRPERLKLAERVHPLLATRGVPGTHDTTLLAQTLDALLSGSASENVAVPVFDKALDDRLPESEWRRHDGKVDIVLVEGWCVGARPQDQTALEEPINRLEREEDGDGVWRRFVNARLGDTYAAIFARIDLQLMLSAPDFECVYRWRAEQEARLPRDRQGAMAPMSAEALARFIGHYERLTRWLLQDEPADLVADLMVDRSPWRWRVIA